MRILFFLCLVAFIAALLWYVGIQGYACGFSPTGSTNCPLRMPWELSDEDFNVIVVPVIITGLALIASGYAAFFRASSESGTSADD
ncbi:hypothetical protein [Celeribacter halophilus]|uniref:hypothetical protein n=1 Tax=Celeribacter halophilus TaxID=576117 RepID=UPI002FD473FD